MQLAWVECSKMDVFLCIGNRCVFSKTAKVHIFVHCAACEFAHSPQAI